MTPTPTDAEQLAQALHEAEHPGCVRHVSTYYGAQAGRLLAAGWGRVNAADAELVALLLTEARAWRAFDHLAWIRAKRELRAAVLGLLEAEAES